MTMPSPLPGETRRLPALVIVEYGDQGAGPLARLHVPALLQPDLLIERVRTDLPPGRHVADVNEAFEFSGYQEGLMRIVNAARRDAVDPMQAMTVVLCNDTLNAGHFAPLTRTVLSLLLRFTPDDSSRQQVVGLMMPCSDAVLRASGGLGYVSTWAFALVGSLQQLEQVRLYGPNEIASRVDTALQRSLPADYVAAIRAWLEPTNWLAGWYKAVPHQALPVSTWQRKLLTIHLEHTLLVRLAQQGFMAQDIGQGLGWLQRFQLRVMRLGDRAQVNMLKLHRRLSYLFRGLAK